MRANDKGAATTSGNVSTGEERVSEEKEAGERRDPFIQSGPSLSEER